MSRSPYRPYRHAAGISVCVALVSLTFAFASGAVPSEAGPDSAAGGAGALEPGTASTGAVTAMTQWTAAISEAGSAVALPAAQEAAVAPVRDPDPSPLPSTSAPPPIEPAVPEAPAEDPAATSTLASLDVEGPRLSADAGLGVPPIEALRRSEPQLVAEAGSDERLSGNAPSELVVESVEAGDGSPNDRVWIVDASEDAAPLAAMAEQIGVGVVAVTGDLRALPPSAREAISAASEVKVLSDLGEDAAWQLEVIRRGEELPGGGLLLFEPGDESPDRRLVAAYGHPSTGALGVLGEQGPEEAVERLRSMAEGYGADGSAVLPTFEIIATVASASPGSDGDYSSMTDREVIRPWIEAAAANGVYVVLDLQPGRSDFLSQAKRYEEFLRLPHVGLALDPEWRLKPHQVHLAQIGTVDAAEINEVADWLAGIVRDEALPQKLLIVHQFKTSMITNRELIETPAELAVLIHMDGQGPLGAKYNTWNTLTGLADADRFYWGWKNFYDEDSPMAAPEQVLELSPKIVFVSFQ